MYLLRQTWNEVFPPSKMYALDVKVKRLDNNWPITAKPVNQSTKMHGHSPAIHVNPDFLKTVSTTKDKVNSFRYHLINSYILHAQGMVAMPVNNTLPNDMEEILQAKTRELLELRKRKLELELEQTKLHLKEQERQLSQATDAISVAPIVMPAPGAPLPAVPPTVASSIYPSGIRNMRPAAPAAVGGIVPVAGHQPVDLKALFLIEYLTNIEYPQPFANKPKVHPVNPAMLSSVRPRDPRLARQMQSQAPAQMPAPVRSLDPRLDSHKASSSTHKSSRSRSKSPMRNASNNRSSKGSSHQSSSSGSSSRKRSESKSSTASTSSSGSDNRHKGGSSSSSNLSPGKRSSGSRKEHNDRYAHNGGSPVGSKRKSSSPANSPTKSKRNAVQKSISSRPTTGGTKSAGGSNNARSRSRSPIYRDVDMRNVRHSNSPETTSTGAGGVKPSSTTTLAPAAPSTDPEPPIDAATPANDLEKRKKQFLILILHLLANANSQVVDQVDILSPSHTRTNDKVVKICRNYKPNWRHPRLQLEGEVVVGVC